MNNNVYRPPPPPSPCKPQFYYIKVGFKGKHVFVMGMSFNPYPLPLEDSDSLGILIFELQRDKTYLLTCVPEEDSIQNGRRYVLRRLFLLLSQEKKNKKKKKKKKKQQQKKKKNTAFIEIVSLRLQTDFLKT